MSSFYKMDPAAWDFGTTNLSLEEEAAYLRIVNAIHKHDQPIPDNDRVLAGMFRCSTRKARALVAALVAAGKIQIEDGKIINEKAISDLVHRVLVSGSRSESGAKGGRTRAENAAKALENNDQDQAIASSRIEENREEKEEAKASSKKRASRLSEDWRLPKDWGDWALAQGLSEACVRWEADKFRDFWVGATGRNASKADWQATWRNWIRKAIDYMPKSKTGSRGGAPQWTDGSLRAIGPDRVQEFLFGRWENRSDLTEAMVAEHPKYIGRTSAYRSEAHAV